jgi:hypothetical protein
MYDGFAVYKTYLAIKLHFSSPKYDYIKYEGKINAKLDTFTSRNDRYFFHKLSKKYKEDEIVDFFVSNFAKNEKVWSKQLLEDEYNKTFLRFRKYKESVNYHFRSDCSLLNDRFISDGISFNDGFLSNNGQHPRVLRLLIQGKIDSQSAIILDSVLSYFKAWDKTITEKVVWPKIAMRLAKLKPFVIYNDTECKLIMKEIFV